MEVSQCVVFGVSGDVSGLWDELDWAPAGVSLRKEGFGASPNGGEHKDLLPGRGRLPLSHIIMG